MKRSIFVVAGVALSLGCGPQVDSGSGGGEGDAGTPVDAGTPSEDDNGEAGDDAPKPDVDEPDPCGAGLTLCGEGDEEECVDLQTSNDHCGHCTNKCPNPFTVGVCETGECPPNLECGGPKTDYRDCNEVCEAAGQSCVEDAGCSGSYRLYYDVPQGLNACEAGTGSGSSPDASCSDPIDWENKGGLTLSDPVAVACCCTQEWQG